MVVVDLDKFSTGVGGCDPSLYLSVAGIIPVARSDTKKRVATDLPQLSHELILRRRCRTTETVETYVDILRSKGNFRHIDSDDALLACPSSSDLAQFPLQC